MCVLCLVAQSCPTLCNPMDGSPPGSSVHGDSPGQNTGVGCHALLQGIFPSQGSNPGLPSSRIQVDSLPAELPRKPKNTGVGSLFLLSGNFPTQELNRGLLHSKNTGVGSHALLQGILPTQGSNPCFLHWQAGSLLLSHWGSLITVYYTVKLLKVSLPL